MAALETILGEKRLVVISGTKLRVEHIATQTHMILSFLTGIQIHRTRQAFSVLSRHAFVSWRTCTSFVSERARERMVVGCQPVVHFQMSLGVGRSDKTVSLLGILHGSSWEFVRDRLLHLCRLTTTDCICDSFKHCDPTSPGGGLQKVTGVPEP